MTYEELKQRAAMVRDEVAESGNTADRVGGLILDVVDVMEGKDAEGKTYTEQKHAEGKTYTEQKCAEGKTYTDGRANALDKSLRGDGVAANEYPFRYLGSIAWGNGETAHDELNEKLDGMFVEICGEGATNYGACDGHFRLNFAGVLYDLRVFVLTAAVSHLRVVQHLTGNVVVDASDAYKVKGGGGSVQTLERVYRDGAWSAWTVK